MARALTELEVYAQRVTIGPGNLLSPLVSGTVDGERKREDAVSRKALGIIVAVLGVALLVISALADVIGIGGGDDFGYLQLAGVVIGAFGAVFGGLVVFRESTS